MARTVFITGCSSGIGRSTALLFAREGWNVVATVRKSADGAAFGAFHNILVATMDVQVSASIDRAIAVAIERFGAVDVVVNNAGFGLVGVFEGTPRAKVTEQFDVNVFGAMDVIRSILPHFRARRSGVIVNVSSAVGIFGFPMLSLYCASKFALEGFSEALAYELADLGISVKLIEPGPISSTRFGQRGAREMGVVDQPEDYRPFVDAMQSVFAGFSIPDLQASTEDVATVILAAASDGRRQLRYVASEDVKPILDVRRQGSEAEYMAFARQLFAPLSNDDREGGGPNVSEGNSNGCS